MHTFFLSADRVSGDKIGQQAEFFSGLPFFNELLDAVSDIVLILNEQRQIIHANRNLFDKYHLAAEAVYGQRPGEMLSCIHATETAGGCGTTEFCRKCGAANAIQQSQQQKQAIHECRISRNRKPDSLDLRVKATSIAIQENRFTLFVITDISDEKRRKALERIFFHDILNAAGNIRSLIDLLKSAVPEKQDEYLEMLLKNAAMLIREIHTQKELAAAEDNELLVNPELLDTGEVIEELIALYQGRRLAQGPSVRMDQQAVRIMFSTDKSLLMRVLGNMLKNALEASQPEETVTMGCDLIGDHVHFWTHNPAVMPRDVQLQIFQRSFSTKDKSRGLGTYSMKLLSQRYLNGSVSFESSKETGTIFRACYPLMPDMDEIESQTQGRIETHDQLI